MNTVLVTGGSGRLGRLIVGQLLASGYDVAFTSTTQVNVDEVCSAFTALPRPPRGFVADLTAAGGVLKLLNELDRASISVHHLINNARSLATLAVQADGITLRRNFIAEFELDVVVPYELTVGLAGRDVRTLKSVVNIGSQYGLVAPNPALYGGTLVSSPIQYGVAKAALIHLTKELAVRLAGQGVRVNCIAYGGLEGRVDDAFKSRYAQLSPSRRMLTDHEVPGPVLFLISDSSSAVTGQVVVADGGWTSW